MQENDASFPWDFEKADIGSNHPLYSAKRTPPQDNPELSTKAMNRDFSYISSVRMRRPMFVLIKFSRQNVNFSSLGVKWNLALLFCLSISLRSFATHCEKAEENML